MTFTLNGIGTKFLGVIPPNEEGNCYATEWITIFYFPLVPLGRYKIRPIKQEGTSLYYNKLEKTPLSGREILKTYLFGLVLIPIVFVTPIVFAVKEVQEFFGIPETLQMVVIFLVVMWIPTFPWLLKNWDEKRWFKKQ